jgi:hypothetical protein
MAGSAIGITAAGIGIRAGWIQFADPDNSWWQVTAFGVVLSVIAAGMAARRIDWNSRGLEVKVAPLFGFSPRHYDWDDLILVTFKKHHWRVECRDGRFFKLWLHYMSGAAPLLREMARRGVSANEDILKTLALEEQFWSKR